jgi:hypothetical protein
MREIHFYACIYKHGSLLKRHKFRSGDIQKENVMTGNRLTEHAQKKARGGTK